MKKISRYIALSAIAFMSICFLNAQAAEEYFYNVTFDSENAEENTLPFYHDDLHAAVSTVKDTTLGNNVINIDIGSSNMGSIKIGAEPLPEPVNVNNKTTWFEVSMKFEEHVPKMFFSFIGNNDIGYDYLYTIDSDGKMYFGNKAVALENFQFELSKWYHMVIAVDNVNKSGGVPSIYTWINGEQIKVANPNADGSYRWGCWKGSDYSVTYTLSCINLWLMDLTNESKSLSMDNFKIYTTDTSVMYSGYNPQSIFGEGSASSDVYEIKDGVIYAPSGDTLGEIADAVDTGESEISFVNASGKFDSSDFPVTAAVGNEAVICMPGAILPKNYKIQEGVRLVDIVSGSVLWKKNADASVSSISETDAGDRITAGIKINNKTGAEKTIRTVLAKYKGNTLSGYSFKDITLSAGENEITSDAIIISEEKETSIRMYFWKAADDYTSVIDSIELN